MPQEKYAEKLAYTKDVCLKSTDYDIDVIIGVMCQN